MIETDYGAIFEETDLVAYIKKSGRNYIIQGQTACSKKDHPKPSSLDYWLRQYGKNPNTKQADNNVMLPWHRVGPRQLFEMLIK